MAKHPILLTNWLMSPARRILSVPWSGRPPCTPSSIRRMFAWCWHAPHALTPCGAHAGEAFQITDDILGIYGDQKDLGKTPGDDVREGKGTMLTLHALKHAKPADKAFLQRCLGNP